MARGYELLASMKAVGPDQLVAMTAAHTGAQLGPVHVGMRTHVCLGLQHGGPCPLVCSGTALLSTWQPHAHGLGVRPAPALPPAAQQMARMAGFCTTSLRLQHRMAAWNGMRTWAACEQNDTWKAARTRRQPCTAAADPRLRCDPSSHTQLAAGLAQSYLHNSGRRV